MNVAYIRHSLAAALHMARLKADTTAEFDQTFEGFFRSFAAMIVAAPLYPLIVAGARALALQAAQATHEGQILGLHALTLAYCLVEAGSYVADWLVFPLVMIFIARLIGAGPRYVPFIVAYNWGSCIVLAATAGLHILHLSGIVSLTLAAFVYYAIMIFALVYRWQIARFGLQIGGVMAAGIVILEILISILTAFGVGAIQSLLP